MSTEQSSEIIFTPQRILKVMGIPTIITFTVDHTRMLLSFTDGRIVVYDTSTLFTAGSDDIPPLHTWSPSPFAPQRILPNPGDMPHLIAILLGPDAPQPVVVLDVQKYESFAGWEIDNTDPITASASVLPICHFCSTLISHSVSWSQKGKQLAIGLRSGIITAFAPAETAIPKLTAPPPALSAPVGLISLSWLSNNTFYAIFASSPPDIDHTHIVITVDGKAGTVEEVTFNPPYFLLLEAMTSEHIITFKNWDPSRAIVVVGVSSSSDIGVIGSLGDTWYNFTLEETATPRMPLDSTGNETMLLGLDVDLTNDLPTGWNVTGDPKNIPSWPILYAFASDGTIQGWYVIHTNGIPYPGMVQQSSNLLVSPPSNAGMDDQKPLPLSQSPVIDGHSPAQSPPLAKASLSTLDATAMQGVSSMKFQQLELTSEEKGSSATSGQPATPVPVFGRPSMFHLPSNSSSTSVFAGHPTRPTFGQSSFQTMSNFQPSGDNSQTVFPVFGKTSVVGNSQPAFGLLGATGFVSGSPEAIQPSQFQSQQTKHVGFGAFSGSGSGFSALTGVQKSFKELLREKGSETPESPTLAPSAAIRKDAITEHAIPSFLPPNHRNVAVTGVQKSFRELLREKGSETPESPTLAPSAAIRKDTITEHAIPSFLPPNHRNVGALSPDIGIQVSDPAPVKATSISPLPVPPRLSEDTDTASSGTTGPSSVNVIFPDPVIDVQGDSGIKKELSAHPSDQSLSDSFSFSSLNSSFVDVLDTNSLRKDDEANDLEDNPPSSPGTISDRSVNLDDDRSDDEEDQASTPEPAVKTSLPATPDFSFRSPSTTPKPEVPTIRTISFTPSSPPVLGARPSPALPSPINTPPKLAAAEVLAPIPAPMPILLSTPQSTLGLGRPSSRPSRSSPLASIPISLHDANQQETKPTVAPSAIKLQPAAHKPLFGQWPEPERLFKPLNKSPEASNAAKLGGSGGVQPDVLGQGMQLECLHLFANLGRELENVRILF